MQLCGPTYKWGLARPQADFQVWPSVATRKRRAPHKIYQKEMFYKPRILYMELTHKLRIGDIYHANICLCNICTGYKCHQLRVCATISKMYPFSNYSQFESPNLTKLCFFLWKWLCMHTTHSPPHRYQQYLGVYVDGWVVVWWSHFRVKPIFGKVRLGSVEVV